MKALSQCLLLFLFLFSASVSAQEEEKSNGFLFPDCMPGFVLLKDGSRVSASLNYSCTTQHILFKDQNEALLEFEDLTKIIMVEIHGRIFVNIGMGVFYEQVSAGDGFYYIQWISKVISVQKGVAYGGYSSLSSVTSVSSMANNGSYTTLNLREKNATKLDCYYFLKVRNKYKKITSANAVAKLYKGHEAEILKFAEDQKLDFKKASDIAKITEYCQQFEG